jgi:putative tryptophan/tyrosine transport system substrate-binding protein
MKRREFITLLGGIAAAFISWPLAIRAQQAMPVIGFLNSSSPDGYAPMVAAFRQGLKEAGYVEGQNVAIEFRWADGRYDRLPDLAADLVRRQVSVIAATSTPANLVAKKATSSIPIVFTTGSDPVQIGLVANLSRPGGNVTGVSQINVELIPKRLELAHELMPAATAINVLVNPSDPARVEDLIKEVQAAAGHLGLQLHILRAGTDAQIEATFAGLDKLKAGVLLIGSDSYFSSKSQLLAELSLRYAVPAIYENSEFVTAGGLMSYSGNIKESYRWAGVYTGRILKGEKPADLPVQRVTKVELIINLKTAKALGVTVPLSLLGRADEVIE